MIEPDTQTNSASTITADAARVELDERRFGGVGNLYGSAGLNRLANAHVCVIGVGGVGSWVVESLARSAVGRITMIDMDIVSVSNTNRQILASNDTFGAGQG